MRDFRHENFAQFYGATVDSPYICIVFAFLPRTLKVTVLFDNMIRQSMKKRLGLETKGVKLFFLSSISQLKYVNSVEIIFRMKLVMKPN